MKVRCRIAFSLFLATFIISGRAVAANQMLLMSDIHFNPLASCELAKHLATVPAAGWRDILKSGPKEYSRYGQDTNFALLQFSLEAMKEKTPSPVLILISGDLLVHDFREKFKECQPGGTEKEFASFVYKTIEFLAEQINSSFPTAQIIPALGNNDSVSGDYMFDSRGPFLHKFVKSWAKLVDRHHSKSEFKSMAAVAGYYAVPVAASPKIEIIVINTTVWSARYDNSCDQSEIEPGSDEMAWLRSTLEQAHSAHKKAWILGHIPPGIDVWATLKTSGSHIALMYDSSYNSRFLSTTHDYSAVIKIGFFGHTHNDEFRLLDAGTRNIPLKQIPSVSPIHENNPAFVVVDLDNNFSPQDYTAYTLNLSSVSPSWQKEYDFQEEYGLHDFSGKDLLALSARIANDSKVREAYARHFTSGGSKAITAQNWRSYWCGLTNLDVETYSRCLSAPVANSSITNSIPIESGNLR